jgi:hypothetical protein
MVAPDKGIFDTLPLNAEGRRVGNTWDPAKDEAAGEQCRAYGAGNIMRMPTRLHVTWENDTTLRIDTDAGTQTRMLHFGPAPATMGEPSWQGYSVASWEMAPGGGRGGARGAGGAAAAPPAIPGAGGDLKVVTTNLKERRAVQQERRCHRVLRSPWIAERRSVVHRHDEGRRSHVFQQPLSDHFGFQETSRRCRMESQPLLGKVI